jgi:sulfate adenylyltransferase
MIQPHGNDLVDRILGPDRSEEIRSTFNDLEAITLDRNLLFDFANIANGVYSPLKGFMGRNEFLKVVSDLTLESGVAWPLPVVLDVETETADEIEPGERIGIRSPDGAPIGIVDVDRIQRRRSL